MRGASSVIAAAAIGLVACGEPVSNGSALAGSSSSGPAATGTTDTTSPAPGETTTPHTDTGVADGDGTGTTGAPEIPPPPYPIVLVHGFFGFESFAGADFVTYFWNVADRLAEAGETEVYTPAVDPFNDSTVRGEQLLEIVEQIVAETGAGRVNLIGHSQGGLDARVVAHLRPDLVASVTTFATPHEGTPVADVALGLAEDPAAAEIIDAFIQLAGVPLWAEVDGDTSLSASMLQLSTSGMARFNAMYPDAPSVAYYSLTGRSGLAGPDESCAADDPPPFVTDFAAELDAIEPLLTASYGLLADNLLTPTRNDGLVRAIDAHHGTFLGCIPADHFDEIGQLFGDLPGLTNGWRHDEFYVELVAWLRAEGF